MKLPEGYTPRQKELAWRAKDLKDQRPRLTNEQIGIVLVAKSEMPWSRDTIAMWVEWATRNPPPIGGKFYLGEFVDVMTPPVPDLTPVRLSTHGARPVGPPLTEAGSGYVEILGVTEEYLEVIATSGCSGTRATIAMMAPTGAGHRTEKHMLAEFRNGQLIWHGV